MKVPPELQKIIDSIPDRQLLRPDEVAEVFQVKKRTVYSWYPEKLKGTNLSGTLRLYRYSVIEMLLSGSGKKTDEETEQEVEAEMRKTAVSRLKQSARKGGWVSGWK